MTKPTVAVSKITGSELWSWKVILGFLVVNVIWGSTYLGIRIAVHTMPPFFMAGTRFILAGCLLVGVTRLLGYRFPRGWHEWKPAVVMGFLLLFIGNGLVSHAEVYVPSNQAALLISTSALWMSWLGSLGSQGQLLTKRIKFGLMVGLLGTAIMVWPEDGITIAYTGAQLSIVFSAFCWALGTIYFRNQSVPVNSFLFAGVQMLFGGTFMLITAALLGEFARIEFSFNSTLAWIYLIVFGSCMAFSVYVWLIDKLPSSTLATVAFITPIVATILGWFALNESMTQLQLTGMLVIVGAIVLVTTRKKVV